VIAFYPRYIRGKRYRPLRLGYIVRGLITQTRYPVRFKDSARCTFAKNSLVLLRKRGVLKTKFNPSLLSRHVRTQQYAAIFSEYI
jgi:ribosomal protein L14